MARMKVVFAIVLIGCMVTVLASVALSQDSRPTGWTFNLEQMRKQMSDQMKKDMGSSDEEWKALEPKIEKVVTLQMDSRGGMFGMFGGRPPGNGEQPEQSDIQKKFFELAKLLQDKDSKTQDVKTALAAYRDARTKVRADLEKARKDLQELVTLKQEAYLVSRGVLE